MFYFDLHIINVYVILPPDLGKFAVNKYIHTYIMHQIATHRDGLSVLSARNLLVHISWVTLLAELKWID
jgi:hypothetical protein